MVRTDSLTGVPTSQLIGQEDCIMQNRMRHLASATSTKSLETREKGNERERAREEEGEKEKARARERACVRVCVRARECVSMCR